MKVLSFDIGLRNLGVCLLEKLYTNFLEKDFILEIDDEDQKENLKLILKYKGY